jgi:L-ascorbate metabolism protein UlaG (beta-lactamase superfamily)
MQLTHFGHACVLVETDSSRLLIDPGVYSHGFEALTDLDGILFTHQHPDHLDIDRLPALVAANPAARLVVDPGSAPVVTERRLEPQVTRTGETLKIGSAQVHVVGGEHGVIHVDIPVIPNLGYVVDDGAFYHPGDSFSPPDQDVDVLGLPTGAPWLKVSEAVEFFRAVSPRVAVPIHAAALAMPEKIYGMFEALAPAGATVTVVPPGEPTTV